MSTSTIVTLARHADVGAGRRPRMNGWNEVGLTEEGKRQALALRDRLAGRRYAAVYASPLARARATARPLVAAGVGPLVLVPDAREIGCGEADGLLVSEVQLRFPRQWAANLRQDDDGFAWPGGETYAAFRARCVRLLDGLAARHPGGEVLVVTHAGVVSTLVGLIRGTAAARWEPHRPGNTAVTVLRWGAGAREVLSFDDRAHLAAALAG